MDRTPNQQEAIDRRGAHVCVDAGAGSGKTLVLVDRIVALLEERRADLNEIVAVTFTDKAAAEMKARLRRAFHAKAPAGDPAGMSYWRALEHQVEHARITTIHSFCASILREHALALGIDPDFTMLADAESELFRHEIVRTALHGLLDGGDADAVRGAVAHGVYPTQRSLESALRRSALMDRITRSGAYRDPDTLRDVWRVAVMDDYARRLSALPRSRGFRQLIAQLRELDGACLNPKDGREALRIRLLDALEPLGRARTPQEIQHALTGLLDNWKVGSTRKKSWVTAEDFEEIRNVQNSAKKYLEKFVPPEFDDAVEAHAAALTCAFVKTYAQTAAQYDEAKRQRAGMDFEDLIRIAHRALTSDEALRARIAGGIKYLLVDEFQDTDALQLELARVLMRTPERDGAELFVVGDAKQSIYNFRGAEVEVFRDAQAMTDHTIPLDKNFRALPDVLNFVNAFFHDSRLLTEVEPDYRPLATHRGRRAGARVEFLVPEAAEGASADEYRRMEGELIADRIAAMCEGAERVTIHDDGDERPAAFGDVAIAFRAASNLHLYEDCLRRRGVPFNVLQGRGFYERQEVNDFRNLLKAIVDPWNELALLGFLRSPVAALSDDSLAELCRERRGLALALASDYRLRDPEQDARLTRVRTLLGDLRARTEMPLAAFLRYLLSETGIEAIYLTQHHGVQKAMNLRKLAELAENFSGTRRPTLPAYVRYLDEIAMHEIREGDAPMHASGTGAVTLMTIHQAKGLEFPIFVIADSSRDRRASRSADYVYKHRRLGLAARFRGDDGRWVMCAAAQAIARADDEEQAAEEARVLYVAMTRARDWLLIGGGPAPRSDDNWFSTLDETYALTERKHGATFDGGDWSAVVRRVPGTHTAGPQESVPSAALASSALAARIGAVSAAKPMDAATSVSQLLDLAEAEAAPAMESAPGSAAGDALFRGSLAHALFESWAVERDVPPPIEQVLRKHCMSLRARREYELYLRDIAERFSRSELYERIRGAAHVQREVPFTWRVGGQYVNGVIDAVLDNGTIIDYKTGTVNERARHRYERQLQLYAGAVRDLLDIECQAAILYFVDSGESVAIAPSAEAITSVLTRGKGVSARSPGG